jgi:large subunit ribosomal protein L21
MRYEIQIDMRVLSFREQLSLLAAGVGLLFERLQGKKTAVAAPPDDLTAIKGIGPTFARRLQEAGITSFAALAALSPEEARQFSGATNWQADPADWIVEAKALADK